MSETILVAISAVSLVIVVIIMTVIMVYFRLLVDFFFQRTAKLFAIFVVNMLMLHWFMVLFWHLHQIMKVRKSSCCSARAW